MRHYYFHPLKAFNLIPIYLRPVALQQRSLIQQYRYGGWPGKLTCILYGPDQFPVLENSPSLDNAGGGIQALLGIERE